MKKRSFLAGLVIVAAICFGSIASASDIPDVSSFKDVASSYFSGYVKHNIQETAKFSGEDLKKLERQFELNKDNPLRNFEITQIDESNPQNISFYVEFTYDDLGTLPPVPYQAVLEEGEYKIKPVENVIVDMNPDSPEYRSVVVQENVSYASEDQGTGISPAVTLSYYAGDFIGENEFKFFDDALFNTTKGSVTIIGWQQSNLGVVAPPPTVLRYTIATPAAGNQIIKLGNAVQIGGEYKRAEDRFNRVCTSITNGTNRALLVENKGSGNVKFAGNTYE